MSIKSYLENLTKQNYQPSVISCGNEFIEREDMVDNVINHAWT